MSSTGIFITVLLLILAAAAVLGARRRRQEAGELRREIEESFGRRSPEELSEEKARLLRNHADRIIPGESEASETAVADTGLIDDITWNDLDMDRLYAEMDTCRSGAGEWMLYTLLRHPVRVWESLSFREVQLAFWGDEKQASLRTSVREALSGTGSRGDFEGLRIRHSLEDARELTWFPEILALLFPAASLLIMFADTRVGLLLFLASLAFNIVRYFRTRASIAVPLRAIAQMLRLARSTARLPDLSGTPYAEDYEKILTLSRRLSALGRGSGLLLRDSGDPFRAVLDYLCMLLHPDLMLYIPVLKRARRQAGEAEELYQLLGRLDASLAIASWRQSLPVWCVPAPGISRDSGVFNAREAVHPLLDSPVPNDLETSRCILVTGSNASGKSTFLKACALAAILGQTVGTVPAREYAAPCFRIYTSMALRDSLREGESYFIVEIRSLKRILDAADEGGPVLACIDEVLRGTGTVERIAASTEILRELAGKGVLCMAATHDGELCSLLDDCFDNYHFSEELSEGDVRFSYRLQRGPSRTRNAIRLLKDLSYDRDLVERAEQRAQAFLKEGKWQK